MNLWKRAHQTSQRSAIREMASQRILNTKSYDNHYLFIGIVQINSVLFSSLKKDSHCCLHVQLFLSITLWMKCSYAYLQQLSKLISAFELHLVVTLFSLHSDDPVSFSLVNIANCCCACIPLCRCISEGASFLYWFCCRVHDMDCYCRGSSWCF